jgi:flagellar hook-length control protein FliK
VAPETSAPVIAQPVEAAAAPVAPQATLKASIQSPAPQIAHLVPQENGRSEAAAKTAQAPTAVPSTAPTAPSAPRILGPEASASSIVPETDAGPESALPAPGRAHTAQAAPLTAGAQAAAAGNAAFIPAAAATGASPDAAALAKAGLVPLANPVLLAALAPATTPSAVPLTAEVPALPGESSGGPAAPGGTPGGASTPKATQAEMIARMVAVAKLLSKANGDRTFLLKLNPPDLGRVQVRLQVENGRVEASVHTETHAARHAILQNLEQLKASLLDQGLQLGRFDVSVEGQDGNAAQFAEGQGGRRRRSPEEELADSLLSAPLVDPRRRAEDEEPGEALVSDAMAVDLLA